MSDPAPRLPRLLAASLALLTALPALAYDAPRNALRIEKAGSALTQGARAALQIPAGRGKLRLVTNHPSYGLRAYDFARGRGAALQVSLGGRRRAVRTVLFDLDGTVVDTRQVIDATIRWAADEVGVTLRPDEVAALGNGQSYAVVVDKLAPGRSLEDRAALSMAMSRETTRREEAGEAQAYAGLRATIEALRRRGVRVGAVTSRPTEAAHNLLLATGLASLFDVVVGTESYATGAQHNMVAGKPAPGRVSPHKPAPEPLLEALSVLGGHPDEAIYIGDTAGDVAAAHHAGLGAIALSHGFGTRAQLLRERPDRLIDTSQQLTQLLGL